MATRFRQMHVCLFALAAAVACCTAPLSAQTTNWLTPSTDTDFFNAANWDNGVPNSINVGIIDSTDVNQVAIIDASTGSVTLDGMSLGETFGGANVIQNGGVLNFEAFTTTKIGGDGPNPTSWVMNNDAMILYDGPLTGGGAGYGFDGLNRSDFDVGNGPSVTTFELHDSAILRIADDMKISDNGTPAGATVSLDGNAQITAGSGTSIGSDGPGALMISGNALYVSGNSAGPGNTAEGYTNEGYLTMHETEINVSDNGRLWIRTLQHRGGEANIVLENNARFDIFDVFFNAAPDLGNATVEGDVGSGSERTSEIAENPGDVATITIKDSAVMTVDSNGGGSTWSGLAISGGTNRGGNGGGGTSLIDVRDQGEFTVQHNLNMTMGTDFDAKSTLKVTGPDATVAVNGDLRMALDPDGFVNDGTATLHAVITGDEHTTIAVGGNAEIGAGSLVVELDGYTPSSGDSYELLTAASVLGGAFASMDFTLATLVSGLSWEVDVQSTSVVLNVTGVADLSADFDKDGDVDGDDFLIWQSNFGTTSGATSNTGDTNGDGAVNGDDFLEWQQQFGSGVGGSGSAAIPEPTSAALACLALVGLFAGRRR